MEKSDTMFFFQLLPNLAFNDLMSVHIVHNGKFLENHHMFVTDKLAA
jgi:hypothetical protein